MSIPKEKTKNFVSIIVLARRRWSYIIIIHSLRDRIRWRAAYPDFSTRNLVYHISNKHRLLRAYFRFYSQLCFSFFLCRSSGPYVFCIVCRKTFNFPTSRHSIWTDNRVKWKTRNGRMRGIVLRFLGYVYRFSAVIGNPLITSVTSI